MPGSDVKRQAIAKAAHAGDFAKGGLSVAIFAYSEDSDAGSPVAPTPSAARDRKGGPGIVLADSVVPVVETGAARVTGGWDVPGTGDDRRARRGSLGVDAPPPNAAAP